MIAGAIGGATAAHVMNHFQSLWTMVATELEKRRGDQPRQERGGDDATVKTANAISHLVIHRDLTDDEKKWAGPAVHYAFGTALGAVYGLLVNTEPRAGSGCGTVYGSAVWLGMDEVAVPAAGLAPPPADTPVSSHIKALASHLIYGFITDLVRRAILKAT